jgi:glycosyltransferase involved in cell wall biosynthesis
VPEIAADGVEALVVRSRRPDELARNIRTLVEDSLVRERLSSAAREKSRLYDAQCYCSSLLQVYESVAADRYGAKEAECASPS